MWTAAQAHDWHAKQGWLCGFNYLPRTAVNSTEMWSAETFDPVTIEQELGWARAVGFNAVRVFLQEQVFANEGERFLVTLDRFLDLASRHGLGVVPILFDDCAFAGKSPYYGTQDAPVPGVHNSGWTPSPSRSRVENSAEWPSLRAYVNAVVGRFADDPRILCWDVYNEPGNEGMENRSLPLLEAAFGWVREKRPVQPLTAGVWNDALTDLNAASTALSDVISFHSYDSLPELKARILRLRKAERPLFLTEWMRRGFGSEFATHLPFLREAGIGCFHWGLVNGKTQTHFPWGSPPNAPEPALWFHDLLRPDGSPYDAAEIALLREYCP